MISKLAQFIQNRFRKPTYTNGELQALLDALIVANTSEDSQVKDHIEFLHETYQTLDKIPYSDGMKLIALVAQSRS